MVYYNIGQMAEFLGISRDTIKFYEEKGLIFPIKDKENGYRKYTMEDIHNLFFINFYRELGLEIKKIKELRDNEKIEDVDMILKDREEMLLKEIEEKKNVLKKTKKAREGYLKIKSDYGKFKIKSFGPFKVLEAIDGSSIDEVEGMILKYKDRISNSGLSKRAHTLDFFIKEYSFNEVEVTGEKHIVFKNARKKEGNLFFEKCIYTIIKAPVVTTDEEGFRIMKKYFEKFEKTFKDLGEVPLGKIYLKLILSNFEEEKEMMYLEAFMPIK